MWRWGIGALTGLVGLGGLWLAASSGTGGGQTFGLVVAVVAVLAVFYLIKLHYDAQEAARSGDAGRGPARRSAPPGGASPSTATGTVATLEAFMPKNPMDTLAIATIFGILSLGGIPVATYASGFGSWFGYAMFFGCGAIAGAAGLNWWRLTFGPRRD